MKKISRLIAFLALSVSFMTPLLANAQINTTYIKGYSDSIISIINSILVPVLIAIAFITFLWGVYKYFILGAADERSRTDGRQFTLWGIIGFVVILSLWGIVNLFMGTLGLTASNVPAYPTLGAPSSGSTGGTSVFSSTGTTVGNGTNGGSTLGNTGGVTPAQAAYNTCIGGSNSNAQCQAAYAASGGTGSGAQNQAQGAYNTCIGNGYAPTDCTAAYTAYGGSGTPNSSGNGPGVGATGNAAFDACITAGGGVAECRAQTGGSSGGSSSTDYGCGPGNGYPDSFGSCSGGSSSGSTSHVDGTSCETTTVDSYPVSGYWSNGTCITD